MTFIMQVYDSYIIYLSPIELIAMLWQLLRKTEPIGLARFFHSRMLTKVLIHTALYT